MATAAIQRRYSRALSSSQGIVWTVPESNSAIRRSISTRHASSTPSLASASTLSIRRRISVARSSGSSFIASSNNCRADFSMHRSYHSGGPIAVPRTRCLLEPRYISVPLRPYRSNAQNWIHWRTRGCARRLLSCPPSSSTLPAHSIKSRRRARRLTNPWPFAGWSGSDEVGSPDAARRGQERREPRASAAFVSLVLLPHQRPRAPAQGRHDGRKGSPLIFLRVPHGGGLAGRDVCPRLPGARAPLPRAARGHAVPRPDVSRGVPAAVGQDLR